MNVLAKESEDDIKKHYLYPGAIFVSREPYVVSTILGSCVSVILHDIRLGYSGVNHYIMPLWNGDGLPTPKFGNVSIKRLVDKMMSLGSGMKDLKAKIFGGASIYGKEGGLINVGGRNIKVAEDTLAAMGIPIIAEDLAGKRGRKLVITTETAVVLLKHLNNSLLDGKRKSR